MTKLRRNIDQESGRLETVLEVPVPEEMLSSSPPGRIKKKSWPNFKEWMMQCLTNEAKPAPPPEPSLSGFRRRVELQLLLGVVGAPLISHPLPLHPHSFSPIKTNDHLIMERSMAKYIVGQYVAASGGEEALSSVDSMYAMGRVKMATSEFTTRGDARLGSEKKKKKKKKKEKNGGHGEMGGFVLWQKRRPDQWNLELMVSGCKISAGSDGEVAWRQTPWQTTHSSRGPPWPLRRSLQGLDPKSTANLFSNSICIGEKKMNEEDCFILKLEAEPRALKSRSKGKVEMITHTVWGYFSQRTGLLIHLHDSQLLRIKSSHDNAADVFWETSTTSVIEDYRVVNGVSIAHAGRTTVSLLRYSGVDCQWHHTTTRMEEVWSIEEVDFNIVGLSNDCFLPPGELNNNNNDNDNNNNCSITMTKMDAIKGR